MKIEHLFENDDDFDVQEATKEIFSQPFYKNNDFQKYFLMHTSNSNTITENYTIVDAKRGRQPTDSAKFVHNYVNELATKEIGFPLRSDTLFVYPQKFSNIGIVGRYDYIIVPNGNYELYYYPNLNDFTVKYKVGNILKRRINQVFNGVIESSAFSEIIDKNLKNLSVDIKRYIFVQSFIRNLKRYVTEAFTSTLNIQQILALESFKDVYETMAEELKINLDTYYMNFNKFYTTEDEYFELDKSVYDYLFNRTMYELKLLLDDIKLELQGYVDGIQKSKSITEDMEKAEIMIYADSYYFIKRSAYSLMILEQTKP